MINLSPSPSIFTISCCEIITFFVYRRLNVCLHDFLLLKCQDFMYFFGISDVMYLLLKRAGYIHCS